jgi:hypothetical protein
VVFDLWVDDSAVADAVVEIKTDEPITVQHDANAIIEPAAAGERAFDEIESRPGCLIG